MQFPPISCQPFRFGLHIPLGTLFSNTLRLYSSSTWLTKFHTHTKLQYRNNYLPNWCQHTSYTINKVWNNPSLNSALVPSSRMLAVQSVQMLRTGEKGGEKRASVGNALSDFTWNLHSVFPDSSTIYCVLFYSIKYIFTNAILLTELLHCLRLGRLTNNVFTRNNMCKRKRFLGKLLSFLPYFFFLFLFPFFFLSFLF